MQEERLFESLCNIIGILMMRQGVDELLLEQDELRSLVLKNEGKVMEFFTDNNHMRVRLIEDSGVIDDAYVINSQKH